MLKLRQVGSNMTEVEIGRATVLFSYEAPVACHIQGQGYFRTSKKWSVTTSKHIGKWLSTMRPVDAVQEREQSFFDDLVAA